MLVDKYCKNHIVYTFIILYKNTLLYWPGGGPGLPAGRDRLLAVPALQAGDRRHHQHGRGPGGPHYHHHQCAQLRHQHVHCPRPEELHRGVKQTPKVSILKFMEVGLY